MTSATPAACASAAAPRPGVLSPAARHRPIARIGRSVVSLARSRRPASAAEPCPRCGTPRNGQFCEACGYNFAGPRFTPTTAAAPPPPAPRAYSSSQPGPGTGSYSSGQPGPGSGGYSSAQPQPPAPQRAPQAPAPPSAGASRPCRLRPPPPPPPVDVLVSVSAGHLDRGGGCGPRLLRAGAGGHRTGGFGRRFSLPTTPNAVSSSWATRCGSGGGAYRAAWPRRST